MLFFAFIRTGSTQSLDNTVIMNTSVPYLLILSFLIAILAGWGMGCGLWSQIALAFFKGTFSLDLMYSKCTYDAQWTLKQGSPFFVHANLPNICFSESWWTACGVLITSLRNAWNGNTGTIEENNRRCRHWIFEQESAGVKWWFHWFALQRKYDLCTPRK